MRLKRAAKLGQKEGQLELRVSFEFKMNMLLCLSLAQTHCNSILSRKGFGREACPCCQAGLERVTAFLELQAKS